MEEMDAYIGIRGAANSSEFADVPIEQMDLYQRLWWQPVHSQIRVPRTRWVVLRYPTDSMAQAANMSSEAFEDFYFSRLHGRLRPDGPRPGRRWCGEWKPPTACGLVGPGTDLYVFDPRHASPALPRPAEHSRWRSVHGPVPRQPQRHDPLQRSLSRYQGTVFQDIEFEFREGKIVRAACAGETEKLNQVLDADEGARYIGEWSIGCNNRVRQPMLDTLFDEKIGGSIHLTPGNAYDECDNGNRSRVHWDLVLIQTPDWGGGEIWFDDVLIREGRPVLAR